MICSTGILEDATIMKIRPMAIRIQPNESMHDTLCLCCLSSWPAVTIICGCWVDSWGNRLTPPKSLKLPSTDRLLFLLSRLRVLDSWTIVFTFRWYAKRPNIATTKTLGNLCIVQSFMRWPQNSLFHVRSLSWGTSRRANRHRALPCRLSSVSYPDKHLQFSVRSDQSFECCKETTWGELFNSEKNNIFCWLSGRVLG